jgi:hypothetical protein
MESSVEPCRSDENQPGVLASMWWILLDIAHWLAEKISLTEEEQIRAGIYVGGEKVDTDKPIGA